MFMFCLVGLAFGLSSCVCERVIFVPSDFSFIFFNLFSV